MHWYGGSIAEAVNLSKQRNAIFVVFVEGDNELSTEMATTIDDAAVVKRLSDENNFLAVKLKSGSTNYTHFAQIYQFVPVPSLFFIGRNGTPLEVVCAGVEAPNLATRIDRILAEHRKENVSDQPTVPNVQPSTSTQNIKEQTASLLQSEATVATATVQQKTGRSEPGISEPAAKIQKTDHHEVTKSGQEYEVVCDGDVCVRKPKVAKPDEAGPSQKPEDSGTSMETDGAAAEDTVSMEEKLERAKELIEARRREKAEKEKELEKQKEVERRSQGQGVAELKRWQAEQELKQIQEERKREKLENNLARQRILEQIAQDRAERQARDQATPTLAQNAPSTPTLAQNVQSTPAVPTSGDGSSRARVQFKLPDGTSHTAHFDADGTLGDIQRYISDNLHMAASSFSLWTAFPRRELTESGETLRRLQLAPSAALLVLPRRQPAQVATPSAFASLIAFFTQIFTSLVLEPSQLIYDWLRSRLVGDSPPPTRRSDSPTRRQTPPPGIRRRGNIHRLPGDRANDESDDNNTWNGNSTQQM